MNSYTSFVTYWFQYAISDAAIDALLADESYVNGAAIGPGNLPWTKEKIPDYFNVLQTFVYSKTRSHGITVVCFWSLYHYVDS